MARTTKLDQDLTDRICALIRQGIAGYRAAEANGVSSSTYYRWLERAEESHDTIDPTEHTKAELQTMATNAGVKTAKSWTRQQIADAILSANPYREFWESVKKADAEAEAFLHNRVFQAAFEGDWKAAMTILERRYAERYARRQIIRLNQAIADADEDPLNMLAEGRARLRLLEGGAG